ncbi:MAG: universal stress protein [Solirubrobacterales bacterium]|nr:universal stress protein [Solirubrobacterales bacterium]
MRTVHPADQQTADMFEEVVVAVGEDDTGRDAVALGKKLASGHARLTLVHVHVAASNPAPDSGAVGDAAKRRYACERLAELAGEFSVAAQVSCVEGRSVRRGLHEVVSSRHADLLVIGAHKYRPIDHLLEGSTSQRLAGRASSPLLVLPSAR